MENDERQERLRKLKQNRVDEYEDRIQIKGDQWFAAATGILVVLLFGINIAKGRTSYELLTVAFLPYAVRYLFMYKKKGETKYLFLGIVLLLLGLLFFVGYLMSVFGVL